MVTWTDQFGDVVLFCPSESLLSQMGQWVRERRLLSLHAFSVHSHRFHDQFLPDADLTVIDATRDPGQALDVTRDSLQVVQADRMLVYTEDMHGGWRLDDSRSLETAIRELGVQFILGPLAPNEWEGLFRWLCQPATTTLAHGGSRGPLE
jgi:hypothetical protein